MSKLVEILQYRKQTSKKAGRGHIMRIFSLLKEDKGYVLPLTMFILLMLMLYITGMFTLSMTNLRQTTWDKNRTEAFYLVESGINDALFKILEQKNIPEDRDYYASERPSPSYDSSGTSYNFGAGKKFEVLLTQEI